MTIGLIATVDQLLHPAYNDTFERLNFLPLMFHLFADPIEARKRLY